MNTGSTVLDATRLAAAPPGAPDDWVFPPRFRRLAVLFGSYPADLAEGALASLRLLFLIGSGFAATGLWLAWQAPQPAGASVAGWVALPPAQRHAGSAVGIVLACAGLALVALAVLGGIAALAVSVGNRLYFAACRRRSHALGLTVRIVVPENPALARRLHRRAGLRLPPRAACYALHVDPAFRMDRNVLLAERRAAFAHLYRADYDRILSSLAGRDALVCSSTFSRYESDWTVRARAQGWRSDLPGPLLPWQPLRHHVRERVREQRRMFGAVLSRRRMDRPEAWRVLVFDCLAAGCSEG